MQFSISCILMLTLRMIPSATREAMGSIGQREKDSGKAKRVVIYGAGTLGINFLRTVISTKDQERFTRTIIGFIDSDSNLRHRSIMGFQVLGVPQEIEKILEESGANTIVVTTQLSKEEETQLEKISNNKNIEVFEYRIELTPVF